MLIDARNKLKPEDIAKLYLGQSDIISVSYLNMGNTVFKKEFINTLLKIEVSDTDEITCNCDDITLLITGMDVNWWKQNARRYNKLYKAVENLTPVQPEQLFRVGVAVLNEGSLSQIKTFKGTKDEMLVFLNDSIHTMYLDSFLKATIVINFFYEDEDETKLEKWRTLDELEADGVIKLS